ncbi:Thioredoxin-related transmembrane protein 2 [Morella rubra]|uniref:Thioredoxin-related transmembrane protein 2 n=1 Tax=Morella rubra TaxID=262757 RepID=A0A6A1UW92_9ROSI|nr:Thioredoxin-related transmembrane protein 2 [Morella rubra]
MEKKHSPMEWLNMMVSEPYYLSHFLALFSYLIVRSSATPLLSPHLSQLLLRREIQAILAFCVLALLKMVKQETWEAFIADMLFFAKVFLIALALIMDYHLALWYLGAFFGTSSKLTPLQLEALLTEGNASRLWLVEFRASFSPACIRTSRCFPELSVTYSHKNLSFGIVDLGLFPNAAERFGIYFGGSMDQLPTYILFENAAEVSRIPQFDIEAKSSHPPITKPPIQPLHPKDIMGYEILTS